MGSVTFVYDQGLQCVEFSTSRVYLEGVLLKPTIYTTLDANSDQLCYCLLAVLPSYLCEHTLSEFHASVVRSHQRKERVLYENLIHYTIQG